jgi:hypothetical protein
MRLFTAVVITTHDSPFKIYPFRAVFGNELRGTREGYGPCVRMAGVDTESDPRIATEMPILGALLEDREIEPVRLIDEPDRTQLSLAVRPNNGGYGVVRFIQKRLDLRRIHPVGLV